MSANSDELLEYYKRELTYLRRKGFAFAERYPKIAGRLELGFDQCPDPHIERLIESFAFLTARIQHDIDSELPLLATALLGALYPQFVSPIPSMAVARFDVDPSQGQFTTGHLIPRHSPLFARTEQGQTCRFKTCYPVVLWPLEVSYAGFESTDQYDFLDSAINVALVLRLRISCTAGILPDLELNRLRFHLNGERTLVNALYEILFAHALRVVILPEKSKRPVYLPDDAIQPVGFGPEEDVLPYPGNAHPGYRLLHEYFAFPEKFLFFDLDHLDAHGAENYFDILITLDQMPESRLTINRETFRLGCTPIINLFPKTSEPIRLNERQTEYLLTSDQRREKSTEIHTIQTVSSISDRRVEAGLVAPFFSYNHHMERTEQQAFWIARRRPTGRLDLPGTEILLSFVDLDFSPKLPPTKTVYAHTLCTNRRLAEQVPSGAILQIEQSAPLSFIHTLDKPTLQVDPPLKGASLWRLISHLSLNYLSLSDPGESLKALREILRLYAFSGTAAVNQQILGLREMDCQMVVRRVGHDAWRGFCRGIEISLLFDEQQSVGSSAFLLAAVLNRFFPLYSSINSFTQLKIKSIQREGVWKIWPPMVGDQMIL